MFWESQRLLGALTHEAPALTSTPDGPPDPTDAAVQTQAVASFLADRILPALAGDRGLAFRVRVAMHLLGGLARGHGAPAGDGAQAWLAALGAAPDDAPPTTVEAARTACARGLIKGDLSAAGQALAAALITRHLRASLAIWAPDFDAQIHLAAADDWTSHA
jgi:hypothetical protein